VTSYYLFLKFLHIVSSTVLFGTGIGTAFSMWRAHRTGDARVIAAATRSVVIADWLFTTPAVILQPVTGVALAEVLGFPLTSPWLLAAIALYVLIGACWLPVVWLQLRMRDLAESAAKNDRALPFEYFRYYRIWFALGWPAFIGVVGVFGLMVWKPSL